MDATVALAPSHGPLAVNIGLSEQHRKALSQGLHEAPSASDMIRQLVEDNETVVRGCRSVVRACHGDTVTEDLMNQRMRVHEKEGRLDAPGLARAVSSAEASPPPRWMPPPGRGLVGGLAIST